jgi:hypothetical protein
MHAPRFTGRQITAIVVAVALAVIALPVGVVAATSLVNIADPGHPSRKAHVSATGRLLTSIDGTVDGRPAPPKRPWSYAEQQSQPSDLVLGPTTSTVNVTSLTVTTQNGGATFTLSVLFVPGGSTNCNSINSVAQIYMTDGLAAGTPLAASFPTPLQARPTGGQKICLLVLGPGTTVDLVGYFS